MKTIYNRICIMVPTYKRVKNGKLLTLIESAQKTCADIKNICFSFCVNSDDRETLDWLEGPAKEFIKAEYDWCMTPIVDKVSMSKYWNQIYRETKFNDAGTMVSMIGDDMEFASANWDEQILDMANAVGGKCIIYGDDVVNWHDGLCVNAFSTRFIVDASEHPWMCELYDADMMDVVIMNIGKALGILYYMPEVKIKHNHFKMAGGVEDENAIRALSAKAEAKKKADQEPAYTKECVGAIRKNIPDIEKDNVAVLMCTHNRHNLLLTTVRSYCRSKIKPRNLYIFDDMSDDPDKIKGMVEPMEFTEFNVGKEKRGIQKQLHAVKTVFEKGYEYVFVIDSDSIFWAYWYQVLKIALWQTRNMEYGIFSLFNLSREHKVGDAWKPQWLPTNSVGGFGMLIAKKRWYDFMQSQYFNVEKKEWDILFYTYCGQNKLPMFCSTPTYIQHMGYAEGTHISMKGNLATDFLGDPFWREKKAGKIQDGARIAIAVCGKHADIILLSPIANYLCSIGYLPEIVTAPKYEVLVRTFMKNCRVKPMMDIHKNCEDAELSEDQIRNKCPRSSAFINAQPLARENYCDVIGMRVSILDWYSEVISNATGIIINVEDWLKHVVIDETRVIESTGYRKTNKPICVFSFANSNSLCFGVEERKRAVEKLSADYSVIEYDERSKIWDDDFGAAIAAIRKASYVVTTDNAVGIFAAMTPVKQRVYYKRGKESYALAMRKLKPDAEYIEINNR